MKKVIAFSLWGKNERYTLGAVHNVELAKIYYPEWICRFYIGKDVDESLIKKLNENDNVEIVIVNGICNWTGMFWRFLAASDPTVDVMLSRDADSRLHHREKYAVEEWLNSDKPFHIMRDHSYHSIPILGGMWGCKKGILSNIHNSINAYTKGDFLGVDQNFLGEHIWPLVENNCLTHDEFFMKKPFPKESGERSHEHFVGQAYAGDGSILDVPQYGTIFIQDYLKIDLPKVL